MWPVGTIPHGFLLVFRLKLWQVAGSKPPEIFRQEHSPSRWEPMEKTDPWLWVATVNPPAIVAEVLFWEKNLTNSETRLKTHRLWMVLSIFGGFVVGNVCSEVVINWGYNKVGEQTLRNIRRISWSSDGFWCPEPQYGVTSNY